MTRTLIVNADDFGLADCINQGIEKAHRDGILTSATLLANGPAFLDAIERARRNPDLGIGLHLNLLRGRPIASPDAVATLLNAEGRFRGSFLSTGLRCCSRAFRKAAEIEYNAQIEEALQTGLRLTHLDSEKHHAAWPALARIVERLAAKHGIPAVRRPAESVWFSVRRLPAWSIERVLQALFLRGVAEFRRPRIATPDYFFGQTHIGAMDETVWEPLLAALPEGITEVMTHPGFCVPDELFRVGREMGASWIDTRRESELRALCSEQVISCVKQRGIQLRTFVACAAASNPPPKT